MNKREYAKANLDWLAAKAEEEGVIALPEGIYYKVLSSGNNDGKHPTPRSIVTAHYTGRTINGKKFDSSRGGAPIAFRLSDLIKGWIVAMQQMCVGDKWEVYIPANMGYGKFSQPGIPGGSTLIRNRIIRNSVAIATLFLFLYTSSRTLNVLDKTISRATLKLLHATTFLVSSANSLLYIQAEREAPPAA